MRKRRAIILSTTLIFLIVGYVAWCVRPFYLRPPLDDTINSPFGLSAEDERVIRDWYADSELIIPYDFSWAQMPEFLKRPWGESVVPSSIIVTQVSRNEGRLESIDLIVTLHGKTYYPVEGRLENGVYEWKRTTGLTP